MKTRVMILGFLLLTGLLLNAQEKNRTSIPMIGDDAPSFTAETTNGLLKFPEDLGGQYWKILFSHPQDFTPVCTSEILELTKMQDDFESWAVKIAILSTDTKENHFLWKKSIEEALSNATDSVKIRFPLIADDKIVVSRLYGMLQEKASTTKNVRGVFIIGPTNKVEAIFYYPMNIGRNLDEIFRTVKALQTARASHLKTPANWEPGQDLIVPAYPYTNEEMIKNPKIIDNYYSVGSFLWFKKRLLP
jgi:peroxiredoxin (alkyl hydroperoxide reductase subunit C)